MNHKALKRILVTMPDKCAALLKSYAAQWGMTQSEVLYECSRNHIHAQANSGCVGTLNLLHIHDIKLDRLKWAGKFYPVYPKDCEHNDTVLQPHTYLGWNGKWVIEFYTPVFTWIHRLENLGWLYSA